MSGNGWVSCADAVARWSQYGLGLLGGVQEGEHASLAPRGWFIAGGCDVYSETAELRDGFDRMEVAQFEPDHGDAPVIELHQATLSSMWWTTIPPLGYAPNYLPTPELPRLARFLDQPPPACSRADWINGRFETVRMDYMRSLADELEPNCWHVQRFTRVEFQSAAVGRITNRLKNAKGLVPKASRPANDEFWNVVCSYTLNRAQNELGLFLGQDGVATANRAMEVASDCDLFSGNVALSETTFRRRVWPTVTRYFDSIDQEYARRAAVRGKILMTT